MALSSRTISEIGETGLLAEIVARSATPPEGEVWAGDDGAVVVPGASRLVFATDLITEGIDFLSSRWKGEDVGWKAIAINASDIAAMGARPTRAVVSAAVPSDLPSEKFEALLDGLDAASGEWDIGVVGGDIGGAEQVVVSVAMLGEPVGSDPIFRSGARAGDAICVTGSLGASAVGLKVLREGLEPDMPALVDAVARYHRPRARVAEAAAIVPHGPTAMIDVSDGLARDLLRLLSASDVGCEVSRDDLPLAVEGIDDAVDLALAGGDDYELLFTIAPEAVEDATRDVAAVGTDITVVGRVTDGEALIDGEPLEELEELGWEHLQSK